MSKEERLQHKRHTLAHLLAAAVSELYPDAKPTIGPAIEDGFYYDFDFGKRKVSVDDVPEIEKKMRELLPGWTSFASKEVSADEARKYFKNNPYKLELIDELEKESETITFYTSGGLTDLCRGGHVENPADDIDPTSFKLDRVAGAYWRGDENNTMLTRIYGLAFDTQEELDAYIQKREEAKERDHRKLGRELGLFTFSDLVGAGLPLWTPKGTLIRSLLQEKLLSISKRYGMQPVTIPHLAKRKLYELSGHAEKFGDELLEVKSHYDEFILKPVNCPHHTQIYASEMRSYRDLPLRFMETTMQYRDEKPGEIGGLTRVRSITVDDGHIFCTPEQIKDEAVNIAKIVDEFYREIDLAGDYHVSLSVRDPDNLDAYIGDEEGWKNAEKELAAVSDEMGLDAERVEGEAALYGPKLDYIFKDSLGREWQLATIQIDFAMPKRFGLVYTDTDGKEKTPVMIHRAILGSYERFIAILLEHFAGRLPLWLSPTQVKVLPIGEAHHDYAQSVVERLHESDVRTEIDVSGDTLGKKISRWHKEKVPYALVIGDNEVEGNSVTVEARDSESSETMSVDDFVEKLPEEVGEKN